MSIHLVGGGRRPEHAAAVFGPFADEVVARTAGSPAAVAVVVVHERGDVAGGADEADHFVRVRGDLGAPAARRVLMAEGDRLDPSALTGVAAGRAVGGYRQGAVEVCPEDAGEDLDQVTVREGLGLVDLTVEVHAAQWGTLGRLLSAARAGQVTSGVALDEDTLLTVGAGVSMAGAGQVWWVRRDGEQVAVRPTTAG